MTEARRRIESRSSPGFEIEGYREMERALKGAPDLLSKALWVGTRRSLASFRRTFLQKTGAKIRGKKKVRPGEGGRREKTIGRSFQWRVYPLAESNVKAKVVPSGELFTRSFAAHGLEVGGPVRAKKKPSLWLPIGQPYGDNTDGAGAVKSDWKDIRKVFASKRGRYKLFPVKNERGSTVIYAIRRGVKKKRTKSGRLTKAFARQQDKLIAETGFGRFKSFPIFIKKQVVGTKRGKLNFFRLWDGYGSEVEKRMTQELRRAIRQVATDRKEARSGFDS